MAQTVMIVDDDPVVGFIHKRQIQKSGITQDPITYPDGVEALNYLRNNYHQATQLLIFLDLNMSVLNGWQFLEIIATEFPEDNIRVIIVSSSVEKTDYLRAMSFRHVIKYLEKPLQADELKQLKIA